MNDGGQQWALLADSRLDRLFQRERKAVSKSTGTRYVASESIPIISMADVEQDMHYADFAENEVCSSSPS